MKLFIGMLIVLAIIYALIVLEDKLNEDEK
jgi:hypothetical protein